MSAAEKAAKAAEAGQFCLLNRFLVLIKICVDLFLSIHSYTMLSEKAAKKKAAEEAAAAKKAAEPVLTPAERKSTWLLSTYFLHFTVIHDFIEYPNGISSINF